MDNTLVFSHSTKIKCCALADDNTVMLCTEEGLSLFDLGSAKNIHTYTFEQPAMPIAMWVCPELDRVTIQGKMGYNLILAYEHTKESTRVKQVHQYRTNICGFCKMTPLNSRSLLGVSDEDRSVYIFSLRDGSSEYKCEI